MQILISGFHSVATLSADASRSVMLITAVIIKDIEVGRWISVSHVLFFSCHTPSVLICSFFN